MVVDMIIAQMDFVGGRRRSGHDVELRRLECEVNLVEL